MDDKRIQLTKSRNIKDFKMSYGKRVQKYNRTTTSRLTSLGAITVDDLEDIKNIVKALQKYYSTIYKEQLEDESPMFDVPRNGEMSIKDVIKLSMITAFDVLLNNDIINRDVTDFRTLNSITRNSDAFELYEKMYDTMDEAVVERNSKVLRNKELELLHKDFVQLDDEFRNLFYGIRRD